MSFATARLAAQAGVGNAVHLSIGGKVCRTDNPPLAFDGTVSVVTDDVATDSPSIHAGYETRMGKIAVVENDGIEIVLIERRARLTFRSFSIDWASVRVKESSLSLRKA